MESICREARAITKTPHHDHQIEKKLFPDLSWSWQRTIYVYIQVKLCKHLKLVDFFTFVTHYKYSGHRSTMTIIIFVSSSSPTIFEECTYRHILQLRSAFLLLYLDKITNNSYYCDQNIVLIVKKYPGTVNKLNLFPLQIFTYTLATKQRWRKRTKTCMLPAINARAPRPRNFSLCSAVMNFFKKRQLSVRLIKQ